MLEVVRAVFIMQNKEVLYNPNKPYESFVKRKNILDIIIPSHGSQSLLDIIFRRCINQIADLISSTQITVIFSFDNEMTRNIGVIALVLFSQSMNH